MPFRRSSTALCIQFCITYYRYSCLTDITSLLDCDMKLELDVSGIYCKVAEGGAPAAELSHKQHHWGTCFYLGLIIAKVPQYTLILNTDIFLIYIPDTRHHWYIIRWLSRFLTQLSISINGNKLWEVTRSCTPMFGGFAEDPTPLVLDNIKKVIAIYV